MWVFVLGVIGWFLGEFVIGGLLNVILGDATQDFKSIRNKTYSYVGKFLGLVIGMVIGNSI